MLGTGSALLCYVSYFTVIKFKRVYREREEYEKIKKAVKNISPEEAARLLTAQNAEKDFLKGKAGG